MKHKALIKDTAREIWRTKSRFISIFAIVTLGVGFFAGIKSTCPDMKLTAEEYFRSSHLMDYRLASTYGFDEDDVQNIKNLDGVKAAMPQYSKDFLVRAEENELVVKTYSVDYGTVETDLEGNLNRPRLIEGRYPEKSGECVIETGASVPSSFEIGSTVTLYSGDGTPVSDTLKTSTFTIVGVVESPLYISYERGTSTIGNGSVNSYILLPEEDYKLDVYTDLYVTIDETQGVSPFSEEYGGIIAPFGDTLKGAALESVSTRYASIVGEAEDELADARKKLKEGEDEQAKELADAWKKIADGQQKYREGLAEYQAQYDEFKRQIADGRTQLKQGTEELQQQNKDFEALKKLYQSVQGLVQTAVPGQPFTLEQQVVVDQSAKLDENFPNLLTAALVMADPTASAMLDGALTQTGKEIDGAAATLKEAKEELEQQTKSLNEQEAEGERRFAEAKAALEQAQKDLVQAEKDYSEGKEKSDKELADAREEIKKGERELEKLSAPKVYLFDRDDNVGYSGFENDADKVDAISQIFPVFFIFVAALVCLTTMTRMVEEQRTSVGTLKALGYGKTAIAMKYLAYALTASLTGSVIGLLAGFQVFPHVIFNAYRILYHLPGLIAPFRWDYAIWCTVTAVACTSAATLVACYTELSAHPSQLMRPKPPKNGKRVLLERFTWLWSKIGFIRKVSIRNFFRYKKRVLLTVTGIAGCTALMLTGFGLKDSISTIVTKQYDQIFLYDAMTVYDSGADEDDLKELNKTLASQPGVDRFTYVQQLSVDASNPDGGKTMDSYLVVPAENDVLEQYIKLRPRGSSEELKLEKSGVIVTEKLANMLGIEVGDSIQLKDSDGGTVKEQVNGIAENYLFHYVYMLPETYEELFGEESVPNAAMMNLNTDDPEKLDALSSAVLENDSVLQISYSKDNGKTFSNMIDSLNSVIFVLILSAGALALVVLYNLTNINVNERIRELATLKVLGFYNKEVSSYINRENTASSILGVLVGLLLGIFLHHFVVTTAEVDIVMFSREIFPLSFLLSAVLTLAFTWIVNFLLHFRLKKIDMVESLKSVE